MDLSTFVDNRALFATELLSFPDTEGQEIRLLVLCASFEVDSGGQLAPLDPQPPVRVADEYFGDPACSSIRTEADIALGKPYVDVVVIGSAIAPRSRSVRQLEVELAVGDVRKRLLVRGDRRRLMRGIYTRARAFERMPIVYERAFGGSDLSPRWARRAKVYPPNPVGLGFRHVQSADPSIETQAPNLRILRSQLPAARTTPAGFGVIGRSWSPRRELAGTYDAAWLAQQWPLPPRDFDTRHNQCAPSDQQSRSLRGGEQVRILHMTPEREWRFQLPTLDVPARLYYTDRCEEHKLRLDTVVIDTEIRQVSLSARLALPVDRLHAPLREIVLGHPTRGWLRAREQRKYHLDPSAQGGTDPTRPTFR